MATYDGTADERALIFDIYRGTMHDGPGWRSTVFFKGCPLSCVWCHNPEGIPCGQRLWWEGKSCIGCGLCHDVCAYGALQAGEQGVAIDRAKCSVCGACAAICPAGALDFSGKYWKMDDLFNELVKDKTYYDRTGGGVTASGGEALMQADFVFKLFERLQGRGIGTALDTCGLADWTTLERILPHCDHILYDLKLIDPVQHRRFTGVDNACILDHAKRIAQGVMDGRWKAKLWIRTPLIPGATATAENLFLLGRFISENLTPVVERWELCSFNNSCVNKYQKLGKTWAYADTKLLDSAQAHILKSAAISGCCNPKIVFITGLIAQ